LPQESEVPRRLGSWRDRTCRLHHLSAPALLRAATDLGPVSCGREDCRGGDIFRRGRHAVAGLAPRRTTALRERSRRIGPAWLAQEAEGCRRRLISLGVVGCTFVRAFDKFPLMSQWRIHQRNFQ